MSEKTLVADEAFLALVTEATQQNPALNGAALYILKKQGVTGPHRMVVTAVEFQPVEAD